jgi:organic hydroperoxide reductase OsmC/OhrA
MQNYHMWLVSGFWLLEQNGKEGRMPKTHHYRTTTTWTGNLGTGTSQYKAYSRSHEITGAQKAVVIQGSSDPLFRGDPARYNPEDLLVGALSACHMLWVLHLCADAGIVVTDYSDEAAGEMEEHPDGSGEFTLVTLHPRMTITDASRIDDAVAVHDKAHEVCCLARSVNFPVKHEPTVASLP